MTGDDDSDAAEWAKVLADGRSAEDQSRRLTQMSNRCWEWARKITAPVDAVTRAFEACKGIDAQLDFVDAHLQAIDQKLGNAAGLPSGLPGYAPGQSDSDFVYDATYQEFLAMDPAARQAAYEAIRAEINQNGTSVSRRARLRAAFDVIQGNPYDPPLISG